MGAEQPPRPRGRAAGIDPPNRFERVHAEADWEQLEQADDLPDEHRVPTVFLPSDTRRLITSNDSPDVPFRYSINPYRGCEHGCLCCCIIPRSTAETLVLHDSGQAGIHC
jgi:hypothetical protein